MKRILEPELMEDDDQVRAYAEADFEEPHAHFIDLFETAFGDREIEGSVLDLGCGPGDISFRFAARFRNCLVHAVDGSSAMLDYARNRLQRHPTLQSRIRFIEGLLPEAPLPKTHYNYLISNSLLHHLANPNVLWSVIRKHSQSGSGIFVMDLLRPDDTRAARRLVDSHAANEPEILRRDFYNSLLAAFSLDEISEQLERNELGFLAVRQVSDRHVTIHGGML